MRSATIKSAATCQPSGQRQQRDGDHLDGIAEQCDRPESAGFLGDAPGYDAQGVPQKLTQTGDDTHRRAARAQLRQIRSDDAARTFISKVREQADNAEHKNEAQGDAFCVRSR